MTVLLCFIAVLIAALLLFFVWIHTAPVQKKGTDAMIILGYKCEGDIIHPLLLERLTTALELLRAFDYKKVILTGGPVKSSQAEAWLMRDYLVRNGVDEEQIIMEQDALDTIENISNCQTIMEHFNLRTCTVVSNSFHIRRVRYIAGYLGFPSYYYANRSIGELFGQWFRTLHELKAFCTTYQALKKFPKSGSEMK